jgi:hypothetical protein
MGNVMVKKLIPWILDISVMEWEGHSHESLETLKAGLDKEFEFVDNDLSMVGFRNVVKRWLKTKRSKLKARYMVGKKDYPINIELTHCITRNLHINNWFFQLIFNRKCHM